MKKLFISMLAIAALASCAKEEVIVADQGELIGFNSFVENSTRAEKAYDPSYNATSLTAFNVWGTVGTVAIYTGNEVTGKVGNPDGGEQCIWKCNDVKQYWIKDAVYKFAAVAGVDKTKVATGDDKLPSKVTIDASTAAVDVIYAKNYGANDNGIIGQASNNAPVNFNFEHLLSKVKFTVNNGSTSATGYSFVVKDIVVKGSKIGTVVLADRTWESKGAAANYNVDSITVAAADAKEECAQELLLIPGQFEITYKVDILCNGTPIATHTSSTNTVTIAGGNAYNFNINVAVGEEITFSVTQEPTWANGGSTTLI